MPRIQTNSRNYRLIIDYNQIGRETRDDEENENKIGTLARYISSQAITPFITQAKNVITTQIGLMTGQQQLQERWNTALSAITFAQSLRNHVLGGRVIAQSFGLPAGVGAMLGATLFALQKSLEYGGEKLRINNMQKLENAQIQQTQERAGWAFNKTRRGV